VKLQMKGLVHPRMHREVDRQLDLAALAPGTMEAALLERMSELMAEAGTRFDLVIFDTAPTGHTLRLLALPELMMAWTDGLLRHDERASNLSAALKRFGGGPARDELSLMGDASDAHPEGSRSARLTELLRRRQQKLRRARERLLDARTTGFLLVVNADKLSVLESRKALTSLARARVPVAALIVNRVLPPDADGAFVDARRRQEAPYLRAIEQEFAHLPRMALPLLADDVHGLEALRRVGRLLTEGT
jgi:arsenite/tail-anchored protein-transporting ATPase